MSNIVGRQAEGVEVGPTPEEALQRIMKLGEKIIMSCSLGGSIKVGDKILMYDGVTVGKVIRNVPIEEAREWAKRVFPDDKVLQLDPGPHVEISVD